MTRALAVFHSKGRVPHWADRWLADGYHHVFVAIEDGDHWIAVDARDGGPVVEAVAPAGYDLASFYRNDGLIVIETHKREMPPRWPFTVANCVGLAKALLGIQAPMVWTPYQLARFLERPR